MSSRMPTGEPPRDRVPDTTVELLLRGYHYVAAVLRRTGSPAATTRLLGHRTVVAAGHEAARDFYGDHRLARAGAAPRRMRRTLIGDRGVQTLDGERHRRRKALFLGLLDDAAVDTIVDTFVLEWRTHDWQGPGALVLMDEAGLMLTRAVVIWSGVPVEESGMSSLHRDLRSMVESGATAGPNHWRGRLARRRRERWAADLVREVRTGRIVARAGSPLQAVSSFREDGRPLAPDVAAVELLNLLRPTVAVERYIALAALALHRHPEARALLGTEVGVECFVHEVRRFYPFFPSAIARVGAPTSLAGFDLRPGSRVMLDLHGTDQDPTVWHEPWRFDPTRFLAWRGDPYAFVPQGGGDAAATHRCAGEPLTVALLKAAVRLLAREMEYVVPEQDLRVPLNRMPAKPISGFVIERVRRSVDVRDAALPVDVGAAEPVLRPSLADER